MLQYSYTLQEVERLHKVVFFDIGGPIVCDGIDDGYDPVPLHVLHENGLMVTEAELHRAREQAVYSYADSFFHATLWQLVAPDVESFRTLEHKCRQRWWDLPDPPMREGIVEVCRTLHEKGYVLRVASKYPPEKQAQFLQQYGLSEFFTPTPVGPYRKPDVRFFQWLKEVVEPEAGEWYMIGDRLDIDVTPAKKVGMKTIRLLVGDHKGQQARTPEELPEWEIARIEELLGVLV